MAETRYLHQFAEDVYQVRIPLPFALNRVNCYLLSGSTGWTIVDTGLNTSTAREVWQEVFNELAIRPAAVEQIVLTHVHPDHYGLAGWLQQDWGSAETGDSRPVLMSPREHELVHGYWRAGNEWQDRIAHFWRQCDVPLELIEAMTTSTQQTRQRILPHPEHVGTIEPSSVIKMGDRSFRAFLMPGHSDGHLIFYDADDQLLICGDHVLVKITSNVGLWPQGEPDPLGRYLDSLEKTARLKARLTLPGHGPLITDLPGRVAELKEHHSERLKLTGEAARSGATVYEAGQRIFSFEGLSVHEKRFAIAETMAHLEYLVERGELTRTSGEKWVYDKTTDAALAR